MVKWLKFIGVRNRYAAAFAVMATFGMMSVGASFTIQYFVNTHRPAEHWVTYYSVDPLDSVFVVGEQPTFRTRAIWHTTTDAAFFDRMWCSIDEGPLASMTIRINSLNSGAIEMRTPRQVGFFDERGELSDNDRAGFWQWDGKVPAVEAECWLEPRVKIFPSPLGSKDVPIPVSEPFYFRRNSEVGE